MKYLAVTVLLFFFFTAYAQTGIQKKMGYTVGNGQMPNLAKDKQNHLHLVYGSGDSILYAYSLNDGKTFSKPSLVTVLPNVFTYATRGPQIAAAGDHLIVIAPTSTGNIYTFYKSISDKTWTEGAKVNDADSTAKEGLTALSADGNLAFAVWLDVRDNGGKGQRLFGAKSTDGGKTWSKNIVVYASPDKTVCECCKLSVVVHGNNVYAMFRNWVNGSRDLYLAASSDGGSHFDEVKKLGTGTWKLNGCPMDGGGLAVDEKGTVQTVWRRENTIYAATPNTPEKEIGQGKGCTLATANGNNAYTWTNDGNVIVMKPDGTKEIVGAGRQPVLKAVDNQHFICIWENDKQIHAAVIPL